MKSLVYLVLRGGSAISLLRPSGQEECNVFLICSLEKHLHLQEKVMKCIREDVYDSCICHI